VVLAPWKNPAFGPPMARRLQNLGLSYHNYRTTCSIVHVDKIVLMKIINFPFPEDSRAS
jgi:hypothetical protein